MPGGKRYQMHLFTARVPVEPFAVPMERGVAHLPAVRMKLNRRESVRMIVDTGAQLSVVEPSRALAAKADVFAPDNGTLRVAGVGGEERAWLARFEHAELGPMDFSGLVTVLRRATSRLNIGGFPLGTIEVNLLGAPVLEAFSYVTFDYPAGRMIFSGGTPFVPSRGAVRLPMFVRDSLTYVTLRVGGHTISAMVDTGARDQLFLNEALVRRWGLEANARAGGTFKAAGLGGMVHGRSFELPLLHLGDMPVTGITVDSSTGPWEARIGCELLERWRATFDFRGGALWLESPPR
jgi:predicted aspartyl protease